MLGRTAIYKVNEVTFVATGPIPPTCIKGVRQSTSDGFKSVYVSNYTTRPTPEREVPARGRSIEPKRASGSHAPLLHHPLVGASFPHADRPLVGASLPHAVIYLQVRAKRPPANLTLAHLIEYSLLQQVSRRIVLALGGVMMMSKVVALFAQDF